MFFAGISSTLLPIILSSGFFGLLLFFFGSPDTHRISAKEDEQKKIFEQAPFSFLLSEAACFYLTDDQPLYEEKRHKHNNLHDRDFTSSGFLFHKWLCQFFTPQSVLVVVLYNIISFHDRAPPAHMCLLI